MKLKIILMGLVMVNITVSSQVLLLQETFQDWTAQDTAIAYSITKKLSDGKTEGTFTSNALVVEPKKSIGENGTAEGNGNPSKGRIAIKEKSNYLQLPELPSIGRISIKASSGKDLKDFKLQVLDKGVYKDIPETLTPCMKTVTKLFTYSLSYSTPTSIRIVPNSGGKIFIYDLQVEAYLSSNTK